MSLFQRLWAFFRKPAGYIGEDLQGNRFYEYTAQTSARTRRVVKYKGKNDMLAVANRNRLLAVQWKAWLTHTRPNPPTLQELQMDVARMDRLRQNVAMIEAREREARLALESSNHYTSSTSFASNASTSQKDSKLQEHDRCRSTPNVTGAAQARDFDPASHPASFASSSTSTVSAPVPNSQKQFVSPPSQQDPTTAYDPWVSRPASDEPTAWVPRATHRR